jgi:endoglucanase
MVTLVTFSCSLVPAAGAEAPPVGDWEMATEFGGRQVTSTMSIVRQDNGTLRGTWSSNFGESQLEELSFRDGTLRFVRRVRFQDRQFEMRFEGRLEGERIVGKFTTSRGETAVTGKPAEPPGPSAVGREDPIRLNSVGYLPQARKVASVAVPCETFKVVEVRDGKAVLTGRTAGPIENWDTREPLYQADFSRLTASGVYQLEVPGVGRSASFTVADDVYNDPFRLAVRAMYLWRCGTAVRGEHQGDVFEHDACHLADGYLDYVDGEHTHRDGSGGWHDAGDYNKYVVNAGVTVGAMLHAWERFGSDFEHISLDLPESGNNIPEFLGEVKWELDWLLKMQADDGRVYHKLSTLNFGGFILPEDEEEDRFFTSWSTAATADFVAMMALAARIYRPYDEAFAQQCLAAARKSYAVLVEHPDDQRADLTEFRTGAYQTLDPDDRLWATAELWQTTGESTYLEDFENRARARDPKIEANWDWRDVGNLGMFTYLLSDRPDRDEDLLEAIRIDLLRDADELVQTAQEHGYARPLGTVYYWGANGTVARQTMNLTIAHRIEPKAEYLSTALDAINHLLGRNVYGRSFVTGLGHKPPMNPHARRSGADDVVNPWPGYLVGGPNPRADDWNDVEEDFRTNEIAINWNGALIYAFAAFVKAEGSDR